MYIELRQPEVEGVGIGLDGVMGFRADVQSKEARLRKDERLRVEAELYMNSVLRGYNIATNTIEGKVATRYNTLYGGRLTLKCPSEEGVREVKTHFAVAVGPDDRLYLNTGDSDCYRPLASSETLSPDKVNSVDQVAQEVVGLLGSIAGKVKVDDEFLEMNRKAVRRLAKGIQNNSRKE